MGNHYGLEGCNSFLSAYFKAVSQATAVSHNEKIISEDDWNIASIKQY